MRTRFLWCLVAVACALWVGACGDDEPDVSGASGDDPSEEVEPIVIGLTAEDTGPNAAVQKASGDGVRKAVKFLNDMGGIDGRPIELLERDSGGDSGQVILHVREMVADGAVAIIGPQTGGSCNAVASVLAELEVPGVCTTPSDLPEQRSHVFGVGVELSQVDAAVFEHLGAENGRIGILSQKTPLGDLVNAHVARSTPDGVRIDVKQISPEESSAKSQLQSFVADGVGGVFIAACGPIAVTAAGELIDLDYTGKIMLYNCFASEGAAKSVMGFTNGNIQTLAPEFIIGDVGEDNPQHEAITDYFEAGGAPDIVAASGWDGLMMIAAAIEAAGSSEPADIIATLEGDFRFEGVWTSSLITKDDHRGAAVERALIPVRFTSDGKMEPLSER